jgi:hypothetical protein
MSDRAVSLSRVRTEHLAGARLALVGAGCGLAWSCALRGWMMAVAGTESTVTWAGTFGGVLVPATVVGGLLGWAEARRRAGRQPSGWLVGSPLLLGLAPLAVPGVLASLMTTGQGSGALGMVAFAMLGGYAITGRGGRRRRIAAGVLGFAAVPAWWLAPPMTPALAPGSPHWALVAMTFTALYVSLASACAVPMRVPLEAVSTASIDEVTNVGERPD